MSYPSPPPLPPPYPSGPPQVPAQARGGLAVSALVLGILAVLTSWSMLGGFLFGLIALILGLVAVGKAKRGEAGRKGMAQAGWILGVVGIVLAAVMTAYIVWLWKEADIGEYIDCINRASTSSAEQVCGDQLEDRVNDVFG